MRVLPQSPPGGRPPAITRRQQTEVINPVGHQAPAIPAFTQRQPHQGRPHGDPSHSLVSSRRGPPSTSAWPPQPQPWSSPYLQLTSYLHYFLCQSRQITCHTIYSSPFKFSCSRYNQAIEAVEVLLPRITYTATSLLLSTAPRQMSLRSTSGSMELGQPSWSADMFQHQEFQTSLAHASPAGSPFMSTGTCRHLPLEHTTRLRLPSCGFFLSLLADHLPDYLPASKFLFQAQPFTHPRRTTEGGAHHKAMYPTGPMLSVAVCLFIPDRPPATAAFFYFCRQTFFR